MDGQKSYGILRFVEQGTHCYCSSDCIRGETLAVWMHKHTQPDKEQMFLWMGDVIRQLEQFYRCGDEVCYQYVNPFGFIIGKDDKLYLLDKEAGENAKLLKYMQRRTVRELFLPPGNTYYQKADDSMDLHGIGRTFQYILECSALSPPLTRRESSKFRKIISRCLLGQSKKAYQDIHEIWIRLPKIKEKEKKQEKKLKIPKYLLGVFAAGIIIFMVYKLTAGRNAVAQDLGTMDQTEQGVQPGSDADPPGKKEDSQISGREDAEQETKAAMELGYVYFLELEDYEKSRAAFEKAADDEPMAQKYAELSQWMKQGGEREPVQKLKNLLGELEDSKYAQTGPRHDLLLLRGYRLLDIREVKEAVIRIGSHFFKQQNRTEDIRNMEPEVREYLAEAYAEQGDKEEAARQYESLLDADLETVKMEQIYQRLAGWYEEAGQMEQAWSACQRGIKACRESRSLRILYIRMQCRDPSIGGDICAETIRATLQEMPDLAEEKEFQKLLQEYEIQMEGEQVWVEK